MRICQLPNANSYFLLHFYGMGIMSLRDTYEDLIYEIIDKKDGEFNPQPYALTLVWRELARQWGAYELLASALCGSSNPDIEADDILNWVFHNGKSGDQGKRVAICLQDFARAKMQKDIDLIYEIYDDMGRPDPMTLAKAEQGY